MLNGRIAPKRKALSALLISFLLVLVVPLAGLGVSYSYTNSAIRDEIFSSSRLSLNSAAARADSAFQQLITTSQSVFGTELVLKTIGMQSREPEFYYDLPDVLRVLRAHEDSIFDYEVLLYLHERGFVLTGSTSNPARALGVALRLMRSSPYTADDFLDAMNTVSYAGCFDTGTRYSYRRPNTLQVTYIRTFTSSFRQLGNRDVTAFVSMPVEKLMELCGFSGEEDSVFLILDENGRVILHSPSEMEIPANLLSSVSDGMEEISVKLNGTAYLGTMTASEVNGWKFALISPVTQFWARRNYVTHISLIAIAAALMTGLLLSVVLSRRNYRPIARTLDLISDGSAEGENEFELIQNAWLEMQSKKERIEHSLTTQNDLFRRHYLLSYIQGTDSLLPEPDMQSFLGIDTTGRRYALIGFMLAEGDGEDERAFAMERDMCFSRIEDLFARVFIGDCTGLNLQSAQIQTWLLILDAALSEDFASVADEKLPYILSEAQTPAGMRVSALVTEPVDTFEDLRPAYANMLAFMEYQYVTSESGIVHISAQAGKDTADPAHILAEALEAGRYADAASLLPALVTRGESLQICRLSAMDLLYKLAVSTDMEGGGPADAEKAMQAVAQADSEEDVMRAMDGFIRRRCGVDAAGTAAVEAHDELSLQLEEYIRAHYKDVNLSLGMIGEAFGLTPKYLSTLYKSRTGRSLLEFINSVRIEQAQKLLSVPGMTIAQAAEEVGYASVKTFRRAYVRAEGENPGRHKGE
ncbi:MAG: helix-turn-helix domain-containing protein [Clostridia bacterium]|nr:helix-turn-helix domain-containing protein [Clostridia bacterium]